MKSGKFHTITGLFPAHANSKATKILIYSNDPDLLLTRRLKLEQTEAQVYATTDFEQKIWFMAPFDPVRAGASSRVHRGGSDCSVLAPRKSL